MCGLDLDKELHAACHEVQINFDKKRDYAKQIQHYDLIVSDCLHSLEYGSLDAVEITKVSIIMRDALRERRKYKDKLATIKVASGCYSVRNIKRFIEGSKKRKYRARVMKGLKYE